MKPIEKERFAFIAPYVENYDEFFEALSNLLVGWRGYKVLDENGLLKPDKKEAKKVREALEVLDQHITLSDEYKNLKSNAEKIEAKSAKRGPPAKQEYDLFIERLCVLLQNHAKAMTPVTRTVGSASFFPAHRNPGREASC